MFGLTELTVLSDETFRLAIIPTVVLPFAVVGMILTSLATWIGAFFGLKLKTEGPRRLLEVLLKPKVLIASVLLNGIIYGGVIGYKKAKASSWPATLIELRNANVGGSSLSYMAAVNNTAIKNNINTTGRQRNLLLNLEILWSAKIEGAVFSGVIPSEKSLFIGTNKGFLYELDKDAGKILRKFVFGQPVMSKPIIFNEQIYFGEGVHDTFNAKFIALNLKDGKFAGSVSTKGHIERGPTLAHLGEKSFMLVPAGKDGIYAIEPKSMKTLWHAKLGHIDGTPFVSKDRVYVGTGMEAGDRQTWTKIYALDLETGKIIHEKEVATSSFGEPFLWKENICFNLGDVYQSTNYGQISCYEKNTFSEVSAVNVSGALISNTYLVGDHVIVTDFNGMIYRIDLLKSRIDAKVSMPIHKFNFSSIVVTDQDELVLPGKEGLYVFSATTLQPITIWKTPIENWTGAYETVTIENGIWYWADKAGNVFSLKPKYDNLRSASN